MKLVIDHPHEIKYEAGKLGEKQSNVSAGADAIKTFHGGRNFK